MSVSFRCWAEVDFHALRGNLAWLRHRVGPRVNIITVVKADAYGHGLKQIAAQLMQSGTDVFGVANLGEAEMIRSVGPGWPILMLGSCLPDEVEQAVRDDVMPTISSVEEARRFFRAAVRRQRIVKAHVKVDTGMGRLGVAPEHARELVERIDRWRGIEVYGLYTHYASAEDDPDFSRGQREQFHRLVGSWLREGRRFDYLHANNSAALLHEQGSIYNTVRPGLLVYGVVPPGQRRLPARWKEHLKPVLSWKCRVGFVKEIPRGTPLSYGGTFVAPRRMRVATLTAGYGDGYLRAGSNRARVLIRGKRCPILGLITMDQMLADITRVGDVPVGEEAVLIGRQGNQAIRVNDLAEWSGTAPWEVLTNITYRVPRIYRGGHAA